MIADIHEAVKSNLVGLCGLADQRCNHFLMPGVEHGEKTPGSARSHHDVHGKLRVKGSCELAFARVKASAMLGTLLFAGREAELSGASRFHL